MESTSAFVEVEWEAHFFIGGLKKDRFFIKRYMDLQVGVHHMPLLCLIALSEINDIQLWRLVE